jgi:xanthine dehydrogenase molybdopterin-binding subunit B
MGTPIGAIVNMNRDGTVLCNHGITRVGCGTNSALDAIVAETLGLDYEDVMTGDWGNLDC